MEKIGKMCGLCSKVYVDLPQHLRVSHDVKNREEHRLLLKYGSARAHKRISCPLCNKHLSGLAKHLIIVHRITDAARRLDIVTQGKRAYFLEQLAALRKTNPEVPMVSSLDLTLHFEADTWQAPLEDDELEYPHLVVDSTEQQGTECLSPHPPAETVSSTSPRSPINEKLDNLMESMVEEEQIVTPEKKPCTPTGWFQKEERITWPPESFYGRILLDFEKLRCGLLSGSKARENARLAWTHAVEFMRFMLAGSLVEDEPNDLLFLNNIKQLLTWPSHLSQRGYQQSTIKLILINVVYFVRHVEHHFLDESKLKPADIERILLELKRLQSDLRAKMLKGRKPVQRQKTAIQLATAERIHYMDVARERIPSLLDALYRDPNSKEQHSKVMGYLMGYLIILTGQQPEVFTDLRKRHVFSAEESDSGAKYRILMDNHKTVQSFEQAWISLDKDEYDWLMRLELISNRRKAGQTQYLFHQLNGRKVVNPHPFLELAWVDAGCMGPVRFSQTLSSAAPQANRHLNMELRKDAAKSMWRDANAAERVYVDITRKLEIKPARLDAGSKGLETGRTRNQFKTKGKSLTPSSSSSSEDEVDLDGETEFINTSAAKAELRKHKRRRRRSYCSIPQPPSKVSKPNMSHSLPLKTLSVRLRRLDASVVGC